jgi:hypothetical protein
MRWWRSIRWERRDAPRDLSDPTKSELWRESVMSADQKRCLNCGDIFPRHRKDSQSQWEERAFCCFNCSNNGFELEPVHLRFWKYVTRMDDAMCWIWTGAVDNHGYGKISLGGRSLRTNLKAHRVSYEMANGPIPEGLGILHVCDTPGCVNPKHLYPGTQKDNARDMSKRGRLNPISILNLRPGAEGFHGAGPKSNKEMMECLDQ